MKKSFEFDQAMQMQSLEENVWQLQVSDLWSFRTAPNGGYTAALLASAISKSLPSHPDPVAVTTQFVQAPTPGPAIIRVQPLRVGGRLAQVTAVLEQQGEIKTQQSATFSNFDRLKGLSFSEVAAPKFPSFEQCEPLHKADATFRDRTDARWFPEFKGFFPEGGAKAMENGAWLRFADGREPDALSLLVFSDAIPRAIGMRSGAVGWVPTVEMTVQVLRPPEPGPIAYLSKSRVVFGGIVEESGELWDSANNLVAVHRQSAVPRIPEDKVEEFFKVVV